MLTKTTIMQCFKIEQGDAIHIQIRELDAARFRPPLSEGELYEISKFQLLKPKIRNLYVTKEYAIVFNKITKECAIFFLIKTP